MVPSLQVYRLKLYTHLTPFDSVIQNMRNVWLIIQICEVAHSYCFNTPHISSVYHCLAKLIVLFSWDTNPIFTIIQTKLLLLIVKSSSRLHLHSKDAWF